MVRKYMDIENPLVETSDLSNTENECPICFEDDVDIKRTTMPCCSNQICIQCFEEWHMRKREPGCVFCRYKDIEFINTNTSLNDNVTNVNCDKQHIHVLLSIACYAFVMCVVVKLIYD